MWESLRAMCACGRRMWTEKVGTKIRKSWKLNFSLFFSFSESARWRLLGCQVGLFFCRGTTDEPSGTLGVDCDKVPNSINPHPNEKKKKQKQKNLPVDVHDMVGRFSSIILFGWKYWNRKKQGMMVASAGVSLGFCFTVAKSISPWVRYF